MGTKLLLGFGGTVIQVVVHRPRKPRETRTCFGGTVIQVVVHPVQRAVDGLVFRRYGNPGSSSPIRFLEILVLGFGCTVIQVVVHLYR